MKLYRIIVLHAAPKDQHKATETYLVAQDDESVAAWIEGDKFDGNWYTPSDGDEPPMRSIEVEGSNDYESKEVTFKEFILAKKGDLEDEEGWDDAYYGVTKWGWSEVKGATKTDMRRLVALGIAVETTSLSTD